MKAIRRTTFALLFAAVAASAGHAAPANPFADLESIRVSLEVGGPLDRQGNTERELFTDDLRRFNRFRSSLTQAVGNQVESCGLLVDESATEEIWVEVYGRPEPRPQGGPPHYVFLVEVGAFSSKPGPSGSDPALVPSKRVLGLADDADLETALIDAARAALPDDFQGCK